jgi:serine protease AprX
MRRSFPCGPTRAAALFLVALAAAVAPSVARGDAFVPPGLLEGAATNPDATVHVIVVGSSGVTAGEIKNEKMQDRRGNQYGKVRREFDFIGAVAADLTGAELVELAKTEGIRSITPDGRVEKDLLPTPELWPAAVRADALWSATGLFGPRPPAIAIVDSGIAERRFDFGDRVTDRVEMSSFDSSDSSSDDYGHGTLVAGIAASSSPLFPGVAPKAPLISLRVVSADGRSVLSDVLDAAEWVYDNRFGKRIGVVNFSLRSTHPNLGLEDPLNLAVERLWHSGVVVVTSAGNGGAERMLYAPASSPFAITVGAVGINGTASVADDSVAPWSSHGYTAEGFAKPEVVAPGRHMKGPVPSGSTLARTFGERIVAPGYMWMSGTSFAAPVVAGAAAQILARNPSWSPDQVKGALMVTARPVSGPSLSFGVGEIDVAAAAAVSNPPDANEGLDAFVRRDVSGSLRLDADAWNAHIASGASWSSASWSSASWSSASWSSASWSSASWSSASWSSASWSSASWSSASWSSASWSSASWSSASWSSAAPVE